MLYRFREKAVILAASSRRGAIDLALHLSNGVDNERVNVFDVRGASSPSLYGAFLEWETIADQSKTRKCFYSLSINPDPLQRDLTEAEWLRSIEHIEAKMGLTNQPRAVVFHEKIGEANGDLRKHCHVVWLRVNTKTLKSISDSNDYYKLRAAARELTKEFQLNLRRGRKSESYDLAKSHGKNRDVETSAERKATITNLWNKHQAQAKFEIALSNAGYVIAQGSRRSHVVVDCDGQTHSLARQISGARVKDVRARLKPSEYYPTVEQAKEEQRIRAQSLEHEKQVEQKRLDLTREQKLMRKLKRMAKRADRLKDSRQREVKTKADILNTAFKEELAFRKRHYRQKMAKAFKQREARKPIGLIRHVRIAIGYETLLKRKHEHEDRQRKLSFEAELQDLKKAYAREHERLARYKRRLEQQTTREAATLNRFAKKLSVRKEKLQQILEQDRQREAQQQTMQRGLSL
ncbi:hypothetical protein N9W89_00365 [Hellea sp.]|nr:hypothetical protein [Hellea sp.]